MPGTSANAPPARPAKMSFDPPEPATNSLATRLPPPEASRVEPAFTFTTLAFRLTVLAAGVSMPTLL